MQRAPHKRLPRAPQELDLRDLEEEVVKVKEAVGKPAAKTGKLRKKTAGKAAPAEAPAEAAAPAAAQPSAQPAAATV